MVLYPRQKSSCALNIQVLALKIMFTILKSTFEYKTDLNFTLHWTRSKSGRCVQKDNRRGVLGAGFRAEEFSEVVGYCNMADYTFSYEYANCRW